MTLAHHKSTADLNQMYLGMSIGYTVIGWSGGEKELVRGLWITINVYYAIQVKSLGKE